MHDWLFHERDCSNEGFQYIIGVDEAGRGPLAGPVVAAGVLLKQTDFKNKINDSKRLTRVQRERAFHEIFDKGCVGIGIMCETVVDSHNILEATFLAMDAAVRQAVFRLCQETGISGVLSSSLCLLVDGNRFKTTLPYAYRPIVHGDQKSLSIACASIVAKVVRDRILNCYHQVLPQYGFNEHKGYGTEKHRSAVQKHGLSWFHRKTFCSSR